MTSNTFCRHLSNGYRIYIDHDGISYMPCCQWTGPAFPFTDLENQRKQINISVPWANKECSRCKREEPYKINGYRQAGDRVIPPGLPSDKVAWLDIQADITCNGGCLICGPSSSSFWQSELVKSGEMRNISSRLELKSSIDEIFSRLDISELRLLQFLGGEPFLSEADQMAIKYISYPEKCKLKYTTNGSIYPKEDRRDLWKGFKEISINFSIDAIGKRFEYLRYPLKWDTVEKNVKKFVEESPDNMTFHINHTVTPFNIFYYDEFLDWVDATFPKDKFLGIHTHTAYGTMSVTNTGIGVREMVQKKYGNDHILTKMLRDNPIGDTNDFWQYIGLWDQRRSTDWKKIFPDIVDQV